MTMKDIFKKYLTDETPLMWIQDPINIYYMTGYLANPHERLFAYVLSNDGQEYLVAPNMEHTDISNSPFNGEHIGYNDTDNPYKLLPFELPQSIYVDKGYTTMARMEELEAHGVTSFKALDQLLIENRQIKRDDELIIMRESAQIADEAIQIGVDSLKVGISEVEVISIIEKAMKQKGIKRMSFDTMVLFGDHAASPHGEPNDRTLQENELVLFDLGVIHKGYASDITRTVQFGNVTNHAKKIYNIVLEAQQKAIEKIKPGVKLSELDQTARQHITDAGYGKYFPHRLGHGIGLDVHEAPFVTEHNNDTLQEGMVITIEPGIYIPNDVGVRIEDDIQVTQDGYEYLTKYPKEKF